MDSRKLRIFFDCQDRVKRFFWFEYKENNLYWGSSTKQHQIKSDRGFHDVFIDSDTGRVIIDEPIKENVKKIKFNKFSFHTSGEAHNREVDIDGKQAEPYKFRWIKFEDIIKSEIFFVVISRPIELYEDYTNKITKGKSHAILVELFENELKRRSMFEFYLSPIDKFEPVSLFIPDNNIKFYKYKLNEKINLVFRCVIFDKNDSINSWQIDKELVYIKKIGD